MIINIFYKYFYTYIYIANQMKLFYNGPSPYWLKVLKYCITYNNENFLFTKTQFRTIYFKVIFGNKSHFFYVINELLNLIGLGLVS